MDDRYNMLTGRIQALEEMVKENRDQMDSLQSISAVAEYRVAGSQELERAMQAHQPTFATLPDASESSTCTLTPASVS